MKTVTRLFINGNLNGLTYTENTTLPYYEGQVIKGYCSSSYKITEIREVK